MLRSSITRIFLYSGSAGFGRDNHSKTHAEYWLTKKENERVRKRLGGIVGWKEWFRIQMSRWEQEKENEWERERERKKERQKSVYRRESEEKEKMREREMVMREIWNKERVKRKGSNRVSKNRAKSKRHLEVQKQRYNKRNNTKTNHVLIWCFVPMNKNLPPLPLRVRTWITPRINEGFPRSIKLLPNQYARHVNERVILLIFYW